MEELIYILIGIAWVAYSYYKKSLKNKTVNKPQPANNSNAYDGEEFKIEEDVSNDDDNIVDDFFSNFFGEDRLESKTDFSKTSTLGREGESYNDNFSEIEEEISDFDPTKEGQSTIDDDIDNNDFSYDIASEEIEEDFSYDIEPEELQEDFYENFDLRKAVIYSEYMNRKYF